MSYSDWIGDTRYGKKKTYNQEAGQVTSKYTPSDSSSVGAPKDDCQSSWSYRTFSELLRGKVFRKEQRLCRYLDRAFPAWITIAANCCILVAYTIGVVSTVSAVHEWRKPYNRDIPTKEEYGVVQGYPVVDFLRQKTALPTTSPVNTDDVIEVQFFRLPENHRPYVCSCGRAMEEYYRIGSRELLKRTKPVHRKVCHLCFVRLVKSR